MSSAYSTAPPTKGKVILHTTLGPLEIELWSKESPLAVRNFVQLCLEGYYDSTIFHRVVKDFCVQGGDPTGTGLGGQSIYPKPFADEFHSRLKFSHRGILGMASTEQDVNNSQFFITLDRADELTGKNTIFGKVVGDTIYNLLKVNELELDDETPVYPIVIESAEVLWNPFDDIVPREGFNTRENKLKEVKRQEEEQKKEMLARRGKGKKDKTLLSFNDDDEEEEIVDLKRYKIKSSHDLIDDPRLLKETAIIKDKVTKEVEVVKRKLEPVDEEEANQKKKKKTQKETVDFQEKKKEKLTNIKSEIQKLTQDIKDSHKKEQKSTAKKEKSKEKTKFIDSFRSQYKSASKRRVQNIDEYNLDEFRSKLTSFVKPSTPAPPKKDVITCSVHGVNNCDTCFKKEEEEEVDLKGNEWMNHKLVFEKQAANVYERTIDDYIYLDPKLGAEGIEKVRNKAFKEDKRSNKW